MNKYIYQRSDNIETYKKNSISLFGSVALGTGVMIGAGLFALIGQVAQLAGSYLVISFILGAIVAGFSAYSYICFSNQFPSAGGIAMYLKKAYGKSLSTAFGAILMTVSMIINESLVARTFGSYLYRLVDAYVPEVFIVIMAVLLIVFAYIINSSTNSKIEKTASITSIIKILGILIFAVVGLLAMGQNSSSIFNSNTSSSVGLGGFLASISLSILAYKGFTTITNSGSEIKDPHKNVSRSIMISLVICLILYVLVAVVLLGNLSIEEIVNARDYALAKAADPILGQVGVTFTVVLAVIATVSGIIASVFAVSRMTAMLVDMELIPFQKIRKNKRTQKSTLIYISGISLILTLLFDMSRIASLGVIFYLIMDIMIHYGLIKNLKDQVKYKLSVVLMALILDGICLVAFVFYKLLNDPLIVIFSSVIIAVILIVEKRYLQVRNE